MAAPNIQIEILRSRVRARGEIAADLFDWPDARRAGFRAEVATHALPDMPAAEDPPFLDPAPFGLTLQQVIYPGPASGIAPDVLTLMGRYDAAAALRSWWTGPPATPDRQDIEHLARMYVDRIEMDHVDLPGIVWNEAFDITPLAVYFEGDGGAHAWLREENLENIGMGGPGHADLVLQKIRTPCVYVQHGEGHVEIQDGWHRTAAALVAGSRELQAVLVPLPARDHEFDFGEML